MSTTLETQARAQWLGNASHWYFGRCASCGRIRDENDKPLLVAKQEHAKRFLCLDCWEAR